MVSRCRSIKTTSHTAKSAKLQGNISKIVRLEEKHPVGVIVLARQQNNSVLAKTAPDIST